MILVIDALNRHLHGDILEDMFRLRARVFAGRLGWDVTITDGREVDRFDALHPAYLVGLDEDENVVSCIRLLQTTGPHMLADVFADILQGQAPLRAPNLWESTRFCVDTERLGAQGRGQGAIATATSALMAATLDYARRCGITDIITVIDPVMDRVLKRSDNAPHGYVGATVQMGKTRALAALLDCTEARITRVRAFAGLTGPLYVDEARLLESRAVRRGPLEIGAPALVPLTRAQVASYCHEQVADAETLADLDAALTLAEALLPDPDPAPTSSAQPDRMIRRSNVLRG
jgi:N-acyl-L-homoserine lactone synthetase